MKALLTEKPKSLKVVDVEKPAISNPLEVIVKLKVAGICGSDVHIYHGTNPLATYPRIMGHEMVGVIHEIGQSVVGLEIGDHVIIDQVISCGECFACKEGRPNVCFNLKVRGVHVDGGYQEYLVVPAKDVHKIPKDLPFHEAVMIEPTSIAYQGLSRAGVKDYDIVFVLGGGALGKSLINALKNTKATIIVADVVESRLQEALELGAHFAVDSKRLDFINEVKRISGGFGPTVSIDAAGIPGSLDLLTQITCSAGRVVTMGFSSAPSEVSQLNITAKELDIKGSRLQNNKFTEVIRDYQDKKIDFAGLVSHVIPFQDGADAFELIESQNPDVRKVVLSFE